MKPDLLILQEVCVRLLKAGNCSQSAFSQKFDVDINIIRQACAGTNAPNPVGAQKLLNALFVYTDGVFKLTVEEFLDITNPEFREIPYRSEARDKTGTVQKVWELVEQSERSLTPLELGPDK